MNTDSINTTSEVSMSEENVTTLSNPATETPEAPPVKKKPKKDRAESNGQHKDESKARHAGTVEWIPARSIFQSYNPRNPLLGTGLDKAGFSMFDGGEKDLIRLMQSDNPEDRAAAVAAIDEHDKDFGPWAGTFLSTGQTQPIKVKEVKKGGKVSYDLINGARRTLACLYNWCKTGKPAEPVIQAIAVSKMNETQTIHYQIVDNTGAKPKAIETAEAIQLAINQGDTVAKIAERYGRSEAWVYYNLKILSLPQDVQNKIRNGTLKVSKAMADADEKKGKGKNDTPPKKATKHVKERLEGIRKAIETSQFVDTLKDKETVTLTLTAGELRAFIEFYGE